SCRSRNRTNTGSSLKRPAISRARRRPRSSAASSPKPRPTPRQPSANSTCRSNKRAMKHSSDRILTTHAGSLPRPADLLALVERDGAKAFDALATATQLRGAVADVVRKQVELGIDVVDDGEYGKPSFVSYINERLGGHGGHNLRRPR